MTASGQARSSRGTGATPRRQTRGLLVLAAVALAAGWLLTQPGASQPLVAAAGASLAFVLPGAALLRAMFPGPGMGRAERLALAIGLQLALVVMCGFLLHLLPAGLSAASWGAILADVTLLACAVAWLRSRSRVPAALEERFSQGSNPGWLAAFAHLTTSQDHLEWHYRRHSNGFELLSRRWF